jgi:hypothetical protein
MSPRIERHGRLWVLRDDLLPGGTKQRFLPELMVGASNVVYPGPAWGGAAVAIAILAREMGIDATLFYADRKERSPRQLLAARYGARIHTVRPGYLSVVRARAREYARATGARLLDWGLPAVESAVAGFGASLDGGWPEVWVSAGSGTVLRGLARAYGAGRVVGVQVGHALTRAERGGCRLVAHPLKFEQRTRAAVPFPSCRHYDAKAWEIAEKRAADGALFWNVMGDHSDRIT